MAIYKNAEGKTLDTKNYTNLQEGADLDNFVSSNALFKGYSKVTEPTITTPKISEISTDDLTQDIDTTELKMASQEKQKTYDSYNWRGGLTDTQKDSIINLVQNKPIDQWNDNDKLNYKFATGEEAPTITTVAGDSTTQTYNTQKEKTLEDYYTEYLGEAEADKAEAESKLDNARKDALEKGTAANTIKGELDKMKADMSLEDINEIKEDTERLEEYEAMKKAIENDDPVPMWALNNKINALTEDYNETTSKIGRERLLKDAVDAYKYNVKLIEYNTAVGNYNLAQQYTQDLAGDIKEYKSNILTYLESIDKIEQREATILEKENEKEFELATEGYTYLSTQDALQNAVAKYGESEIFTDPTNGKKYLKPDQELTLDQCKSLGLPIGTTWREAKIKGITPQKSGSGSTTTNFTSQEKRKLEQQFGTNWETTTTRQDQLNFLYGADTENQEDIDFYTQQIIDENPTYVNDDGTTRWSSVPKELRTQVSSSVDLIKEEEELNNALNENFLWEGTKQALAHPIQSFLNLF